MVVRTGFPRKKLKKALFTLLLSLVLLAAVFGSSFLTLISFPYPFPPLFGAVESKKEDAPSPPSESEPETSSDTPSSSPQTEGSGGLFKSKTVNLYPTDPAGYSASGRVVFEGPADLAALLFSDCGLENGKCRRVLIYCTHSTESYSESEECYYAGATHTADPKKSVLAVAASLSDALSSMGFDVVLDPTAYDLPTVNGAFSRSGAAAMKSDADLIIDLHRANLTEDNLTGLRAVASYGGRPAAQIELSVAGGSEKSLVFAAKLQKALENDCATITRPTVAPSGDYGYTGDAVRLIISIGTQSNTLSEALLSSNILARAINAVINR